MLYKKNLLFVCDNIEIKQEIQNMSFLTKDFVLLFIDRKTFQERFLADYDLQKYHYVLLNTENYANIISELNDRLLMKRFIDKARTTKNES